MPEQSAPGSAVDQPSRLRPLLIFVTVGVVLVGLMAGGLFAAKQRSQQLAGSNTPNTQTATAPDNQPSEPASPTQPEAPSQPQPSSPAAPVQPAPSSQAPSVPAPKPPVPATGPEDFALVIKAATFAGLAYAGIHYLQSRRRSA